MSSMKPDYLIVPFQDAAQWRTWLEAHHADTTGVWMQLYKKASGIASITYAEALDQALCYGWIDGQKRSYDEVSFLQKFTPRRARSMWSKRNIEHVARLTAAGLMTPYGQAEIDRAKGDGRWQDAYDSPANMVIPEDFLQAVSHDAAASAQLATLNKTERYAISFRLQSAKKPETRARRFAVLLALLHDGKKPA